jgi:hypothetical protein
MVESIEHSKRLFIDPENLIERLEPSSLGVFSL